MSQDRTAELQAKLEARDAEIERLKVEHEAALEDAQAQGYADGRAQGYQEGRNDGGRTEEE